jgi:hypothetical protein
MSNFKAEIESWAKSRGWSTEIGGNGHLKFRHPSVPQPLPGSATPSCPFAMKKIKAKIQRAERQFGIVFADNAARKSGRPAIQPFEAAHEKDGSTTYSCTCSECDNVETITQGKGTVLIPPSQLAARFRTKGWRIKTKREDDVCPACLKEGEVEAKPKPFIVLSEMPKIKLPEKKPQPVDVNIAALHGSQLAAKRKIAALLSKVYIADIGYLPGESDESVARKVNSNKELVEIVRRDYYGVEKKASALGLIKKAIAGYRRDVKAFEEDVLEKVAKLDSDANAILKWLDQIDEKSLPALTETEPEGHANGHDKSEAA